MVIYITKIPVCEIPINWRRPPESEYVFDGEYPWPFKSVYELWFEGEREYMLDVSQIISIHKSDNEFVVVVSGSGGDKMSRGAKYPTLELAQSVAMSLAGRLSTESLIDRYIA